MKMSNPLYGAIGGDVVGSVYEWHNCKSKDFELVQPCCNLTDDSILTLATAQAILEGKGQYTRQYHEWGNRYPGAGYGGTFQGWLMAPLEKATPYNSWGNGSAMRVSPVGFAFDTEEEVLAQAEKSAGATHNHPEGVKGAQATALAILLARKGASQDDIKTRIEHDFGYGLSTPLDEIRPTYGYDISCQGTVPVAIRAFLEATSYEDAIRNAISIGGDSDTIGAITGGMALAFFKKMPDELVKAIEDRLRPDMLEVCRRFDALYGGGRGRNGMATE